MTTAELLSVTPLMIANVRVEVFTNDAEFADVVEWTFRDLRARSASSSGEPTIVFHALRQAEPWPHWTVSRDGEACETDLDEGYVLYQLQWEFNQLVVQRHEVVVHAAAVLVGSQAVLLAGPSMSGKTTLAAWMATHGAGLICDEFVPIAANTSAIPYLRPFGLRHGGPLEILLDRHGAPVALDRFERYEMLVSVSNLGGRLAEGAEFEVSAIVFPHLAPDAPPSAEPASKTEALKRLCEDSPSFAAQPRSTFLRLAELVSRVPTIDVNCADPAAGSDLVGDVFLGRPT